MTGCEDAVEDAPEAAPEEAVAPASDEVAKPAARQAAKTAQTVKTAETAKRPAPAVGDDRTIVITPELVAAWQEQTGFNRRPQSVIDTLPAKQEPVKTDWLAVAKTGMEFFQFCGEVKESALRGTKSLVLVLSRAIVFCSVVFFAGWLLVTNVSASGNPGVDTLHRSQLAAQTVVQDFLQNAKINQYKIAHRSLAPSVRQSVSTQQLQMMFNSLPLDHEPTSWTTEISSDGQSAWVTVSRDGLNEVYSLVQSESGWGLASVSLANS